MASRTIVTYVDDLSGEAGATTVQYGVDGGLREIDLAGDNLAEFKALIAKYDGHSRPVRPTHRVVHSGGRRARADKEQNAAIRAWAKREGKEVSDRGRIPQEIAEEYNSRAGR